MKSTLEPYEVNPANLLVQHQLLIRSKLSAVRKYMSVLKSDQKKMTTQIYRIMFLFIDHSSVANMTRLCCAWRVPYITVKFAFMWIWLSFFPNGATAPSGLLTIEASRSHSDTPHSVGLPWMSDQPVAETSIWQHTTFTRDKYPCPRRDSNSQS